MITSLKEIYGKFCHFTNETKAQASTEYVLLAGSIIIAAIIFIPIYKNVVSTSSHRFGNSTELAALKAECEANKSLNLTISSECAKVGIK